MVVLNTSLEYLKSLIKSKLSNSELEELLFEMGFEIDKIEGDNILIDITPDRPDLLSTHGLARAINNFLGEKPKEYKVKKSNIEIFVDKSVGEVRPYTVCSVVKNIDFDEQKIGEIVDFQERLHETFARKRKKAAIGIYPMEKIKPPIYYKALKPEKIKFVPLDFCEELTGEEILKKHKKGIEYGDLLRGKRRYPIFMDSRGEIMSMPPIINSANLGKVTENTKDVFIECSGSDINALKKTLNLIVTTLADFGGEIYSTKIIYPDREIETPELNMSKFNLNLENLNRILGINISREKVFNLLERMGYVIKDGRIFIPCYRTDILHEIDVIDDVARSYGIKNFVPEFPMIATIGGMMRKTKIKNRIRELMLGLGFQEVFTLILTNSEEQFSKMRYEGEAVYLENQVEKSINMVRISILPELLKVLRNNQHYEFPQKIFEVSDVVIPDEKTETKSEDKTYLSALISKPIVNYGEIASVLDALLSNLKIRYKLRRTVDTRFIKGRVAKILINDKESGVVGEFCPLVLENFKLENPTVGFELNLDFLFS